jgi:demethylmenaquinone methyltransferase / 2-methoxy-6-polyprenyl-1,4-benzoquinol methylase
MNDVMSLGMHRLWKKIMVNSVSVMPDSQILDMAAGSGDIAFRIYKKYQTFGENLHLTLADINADMLDVARDRTIDQNLDSSKFTFHTVNGEDSGLPSNHFDYYVIAYGIRNFTDLNKGLAEANRVLKPGGKFLCLEFSDIPDGMFKQIYDFYSFNVIPKCGEIITGDKESYQYFIESIRMFPKPQEFTCMMTKAGLSGSNFKNLFGGITTLYRAEKSK